MILDVSFRIGFGPEVGLRKMAQFSHAGEKSPLRVGYWDVTTATLSTSVGGRDGPT